MDLDTLDTVNTLLMVLIVVVLVGLQIWWKLYRRGVFQSPPDPPDHPAKNLGGRRDEEEGK
jgi:hypothetical protein